jgi:hypothetical protein
MPPPEEAASAAEPVQNAIVPAVIPERLRHFAFGGQPKKQAPAGCHLLTRGGARPMRRQSMIPKGGNGFRKKIMLKQKATP